MSTNKPTRCGYKQVYQRACTSPQTLPLPFPHSLHGTPTRNPYKETN